MVIDSFQHPGVLLIWETSVLALEALKMDVFILFFEFSPVFPYSFLSVWVAARHFYDTVIWAIKPKIKQIGDVLHFLRSQTRRSFFSVFCNIYRFFIERKFKTKRSKIF